MSKPMPANTQFYMEHKNMGVNYTMPTMELSKDYYEIGYGVSGDRMSITPTFSYSMHTGNVGTLPPFIYHKTIPLSDVPYDRYLIKFMPAFLSGFTDSLGNDFFNKVFSQPINCFTEDISQRILQHFEEMLTVYQSQSPYREFQLQCMLSELMIIILEKRLPAHTEQVTYTTPLTQPVIDALYYMEKHYQDNPSLDTIAGIAGYSASHFSKLFQTQLGKPYSEYLIDIRLRHVENLLINTKKSITEIALETGYVHTSNLSEQFKKLTGMSPLRYRKTHLDNMYK